MKLRAPLLAFAFALSISALQAQADDTKPAVLGSASKVITDEAWEDSDLGDEPARPNTPVAPPTQSMSPSDVEVVPPGESGANQPSGPRPTMRPQPRSMPSWTKTPALDEAYEGIIDDTVGVVLHPD